MRHLFLLAFLICTMQSYAQTTPPSVVRSPNTITQVDPYLTALRRLGIPTVAGDSLETSTTPQNSYKLIYNTVLGRLRVYNPVSGTWSDASPGGGGGNFIPITGTEVDNPVTGSIVFDWNASEIGASSIIDYDEGFVINRRYIGDGLTHSSQLQAGSFGISSRNDSILQQFNLSPSLIDSAVVLRTLHNHYIDGIIDTTLVGFKGSNVFPIRDATNFIQKYHLDSAINSVSSGSLIAGNGITISNDSIKIGGNITEDTKIDNPNSKSVQIGSDGDAMNLNVPPPSEFSGLISTYTGFDYRSAEYMSFIGVLKDLNFAPLGFSNKDMVGTFTITGNPFDPISPDGSVMIDGVWEDDGEVVMTKVYLTFLGGDISINIVRQFKNEQAYSISGDGADQSLTINGNNGTQTQAIQGDNAFQNNIIQGENATQSKTIEGNNATQIQLIDGDNAIQQSIILGDSARVSTIINGEDGEITREINDSVNNARALEEITSTSYLFSGQKVVGSDTIRASNSISPDGFVRQFRSGSLTNTDTLNENMYKVEAGSITLKLDSTGLNYGINISPFNLSDGVIKYEVESTDTLTLKSNYLKINPVYLGFYNKEPISQPILPLGSSTDDVIQVLQNLGLVREN